MPSSTPLQRALAELAGDGYRAWPVRSWSRKRGCQVRALDFLDIIATREPDELLGVVLGSRLRGCADVELLLLSELPALRIWCCAGGIVEYFEPIPFGRAGQRFERIEVYPENWGIERPQDEPDAGSD